MLGAHDPGSAQDGKGGMANVSTWICHMSVEQICATHYLYHHHLHCFDAKSVLLWFTLLWHRIDFVATMRFTNFCVEQKLRPKSCMWSKMTNIMYGRQRWWRGQWQDRWRAIQRQPRWFPQSWFSSPTLFRWLLFISIWFSKVDRDRWGKVAEKSMKDYCSFVQQFN